MLVKERAREGEWALVKERRENEAGVGACEREERTRQEVGACEREERTRQESGRL
jgi:hypothetical protein